VSVAARGCQGRCAASLAALAPCGWRSRSATRVYR